MVAAKGAQVSELEVGDRVGYAWLKGSCGACCHCIGARDVCGGWVWIPTLH